MPELYKDLYEELAETHSLARTLVKVARVLSGPEPDRALAALDRAAPLIPPGDSALALAAEMLRVECLVAADKPSEALYVFRRSAHLLTASPQIRTQIRGSFTTALLLDALGFHQQAERLLNEVVDRDIEQELYKDAFLDLLHLYGRFMESGDFEKAANVCQRALTEPALSTVAHDQIRDLWKQLLEATRHLRSARIC